MSEFLQLLSKMSDTPVGTVLVIALLALIVLAGAGVIFLIRSMRAGDKESFQITRELIKFAAEVSHSTSEIKITNERLAEYIQKHDAAVSLRVNMLTDTLTKGFRDTEVHYTTMMSKADDGTMTVVSALNALKQGMDAQFEAVVTRLDIAIGAAKADDVKQAIEAMRRELLERIESLEHQTGEHPTVLELPADSDRTGSGQAA